MIITISGEACTGKTILAHNLSKTLHIPCFLAGQLFRQIAQEKNMDLLTVVTEKRAELQLDQLLDHKIQDLLKSEDNLIIEGRLTGYFAWKNNIPSKRILLTASLETKILRLVEREKESENVARHKILTRDHEDWEKYYELYQITPAEQKKWYTLIISTDNKSIAEVLQLSQEHCR